MVCREEQAAPEGYPGIRYETALCRDRFCYCAVLTRLCDPAYAHVDFGDFIPGRIIHDTGLRKVEYALEHAHGIGGTGTEDAVCRDFGDSRIILCDPVELLLDLLHLFAGGADTEIIAGPGGRHTGYGHSRVDIHIAAVVIADDLDRRIAFVPEVFGSPLA